VNGFFTFPWGSLGVPEWPGWREVVFLLLTFSCPLEWYCVCDHPRLAWLRGASSRPWRHPQDLKISATGRFHVHTLKLSPHLEKKFPLFFSPACPLFPRTPSFVVGFFFPNRGRPWSDVTPFFFNSLPLCELPFLFSGRLVLKLYCRCLSLKNSFLLS